MATQAALSQTDAASSLLSLSVAAASATPIPLPIPSLSQGSGTSHGSNSNASFSGASPSLSTSLGTGIKHHRRLASTGKARRRLSDARDAASRPSPTVLQSAAGALSLATLSLSSSPTVGPAPPIPTSFTTATNTMGVPGSQTNATSPPANMPLSDGSNIPPQPPSAVGDDSKGANTIPIPISAGKNGKKRGMDHKCESCSKIYRHPSCLIKHRWEHTPHWREASKFVLSKHQQVQLLEAAAILSHLSPSSSSLPEDRSLWPSFLSGGSLPKADETTPIPYRNADTSISSYHSHPVSSSVPAAGIAGNFQRATSTGPRLHDYSIPTTTAGGAGGITQLRPGLLGVPTGPNSTAPTTTTNSTSSLSIPVPVPNNVNGTSDPFRGYRSSTSHSWTSSPPPLPPPYENGYTPASYVSAGLSSGSLPFVHSDERSASTGGGSGGGDGSSGGEGGGWSLPRSSLRSVSASSQSRSRSGSVSGSRSDDESVDVDIDVDVDVDGEEEGYAPSSRYGGRYGYSHRGRVAWKKEEEDEMSIGFSVREEDEGGDDEVVIGGPRKEPEWDGLEMEMDMD